MKSIRALTTAGLGIVLLAAAGCEFPLTQQQPPENSAIGKAVSEMYMRAGLASAVSSAKILGKHYRPAQDTWKVVACVELDKGESSVGRDCNDSFELYRMDSGGWMVSGTVNGAYRWLELPESQ